MKQPKEPTKPRRPSEPHEYLPGQKESVTVYNGQSLAELLKEIGDVDPENVSFDATSGYYDDYTYEFSWDGKPRLNT